MHEEVATCPVVLHGMFVTLLVAGRKKKKDQKTLSVLNRLYYYKQLYSIACTKRIKVHIASAFSSISEQRQGLFIYKCSMAL